MIISISREIWSKLRYNLKNHSVDLLMVKKYLSQQTQIITSTHLLRLTMKTIWITFGNAQCSTLRMVNKATVKVTQKC